jgi:hypothetical protein
MKLVLIDSAVAPLYMISRSLSARHGASSGCRKKNGLQYGGWLQIYSIRSSGQMAKGGPPDGRLHEVLKTPYHNNWSCYEKDTCTLGLE